MSHLGPIGDWRDFVVHKPKCRATVVVGRFGSRNGLFWSRADGATCNCGLREFLAELAAKVGTAGQAYFNNNNFEASDRMDAIENDVVAALEMKP